MRMYQQDRWRCTGLIALLISLSLCFSIAWSKEAESLITDPVLEQRFDSLAKNMRCLVCQGQSIADSDSDFAVSVKNEIYRLLLEGKSDEEVSAFLVERYGDFILFRPPWKLTTFLLWSGPFLLLLIGLITLFRVLSRQKSDDQSLSVADIKRAEQLLTQTGEKEN